MRGHLTHILAASALAATLAGSITTSAQAIPLPVTSAQEIAGAAPTEQVQWRGGWGWRGYGRGIAAGAIAGGLLGLATGAAASSYYGYSYPYYGYGYSYPSYSYGYYPIPRPLTPTHPTTAIPPVRTTEGIGARAGVSISISTPDTPADPCAIPAPIIRRDEIGCVPARPGAVPLGGLT
jgi:hypothetical protein